MGQPTYSEHGKRQAIRGVASDLRLTCLCFLRLTRLAQPDANLVHWLASPKLSLPFGSVSSGCLMPHALDTIPSFQEKAIANMARSALRSSASLSLSIQLTHKYPMRTSKASEARCVAQQVAAIRAALKKRGYQICKRPKQAAWTITPLSPPKRTSP